jgi:hypothetical protein
MDTDLQKILSEVERYLSSTGMSATAFGKSIFQDGNVVKRMRLGKPVTTTTSSRMRKFMVDNPPKRDDGSGEAAA